VSTVYVRNADALPKRDPHDHYETAPIDVRRGLDFLWDTMARDIPDKKRPNPRWAPIVLDPGAGSGNWGRELRDYCCPQLLIGAELRNVPRPQEYDQWAVGNFLGNLGALDYYQFDLVIGNPAYRDVHLWVERSLDLLKPDGYLLFLLRLTFLESQKRGDGLFAENPPLRIAFCKRRPSFSCDGRTSPDAYCYVCWKKGWKGEGTHTWV